MQRRIPCLSTILVVGLLAAVAGCSGDKANMAEVKGKVTLDGQPLTMGAVNFIPEMGKGTTGPMSGGAISATGEFTLIGANGQPGAVVGFHKVTVHPPTVGGSSPTGVTPAAAAAPAMRVPPKYSNITTTDLSQEVKKGVINEITLELKSK